MNHGKFIHSFLVKNHENTGDIENSHSGLEIILAHPTHSKGLIFGLENNFFDLSRCSGLIYNGRELHREYFTEKKRTLGAFVISEEVIDQFLGNQGFAKNIKFSSPIIHHQQFLDYSTSLYNYLRTNSLDECDVEISTDVLLYEVLDSLPHNQSHSKNQLHNSLGRFLFKDIMLQLHKNIPNAAFNLQDLSLELGVSKFYLIRTAKRHGGFTPQAYLSKLRLLKSKDLLMNTNDSIATISSICGFDDISTFQKSFKKFFSMSPKSFRN